MDKFKYIIQIVLFGFLILKESSLNPLHNEKKCSSSSQAQNEQFPYIVLIRVHSNGEMLCQGTFIDVNWVLTSAYCINTTSNIPLNNIDIVMQNNKTHILKPKKVIETKYNDVALIKIEKSMITNSMVTPIKLATGDLSNNTECVVTSLQKQSSNDLSLIYWDVVNILKQKFDKSEWYLEDTICHSQLWNLLQNTTDNGTPLICNNHLYGIYSLNEPNIFNNILKYNSWIKNLINPISLDTASETYMTNFVSNLNSISDTNSIVTEFDTNNMSSPDNVYKRTYSKPIFTSSVNTQKQKRSIEVNVEYNSLSIEPTLMKDTESTEFVKINSDSLEETPEIPTNTTNSDDSTSLKSPTQSYSSDTIIKKSSISEKSASNSSLSTSITEDTSHREYTKENEDNEETWDELSSESPTKETKNPNETVYPEEILETEESQDKPSSTEETVNTEETMDKSSFEPSTIQSSTTEKFASSSNPSTTITGKTEKPEVTKYTKDNEDTEETWDKPSSESPTEETETTKETVYTTEILETEESQDKPSSTEETVNTEEIVETEETLDKSSFEPSTIQSSTTEKFASKKPEVTKYTKDNEDTEETWDKPSSESPTEETETTKETVYTEETEYSEETKYTEETEYTEATEYTEETKSTEETDYTEVTDYTSDDSSELSTPVIPTTQSSTTIISTLSTNPSTAKSEETEATDNTEGPYSEKPSTRRPITQSSTTKESTLSTNPLTAKSEETIATEDGPFTETIKTTVTDGTKQTSQTETSVTYSSTITTIKLPDITTSQSSPETNTTPSDHGDESNTTTTTTTPTTTSIRTVVTYDISDPRESSTFVDDQYQDKS
ncbi:mucin-5AC-like, partial [Aphis craccivora]